MCTRFFKKSKTYVVQDKGTKITQNGSLGRPKLERPKSFYPPNYTPEPKISESSSVFENAIQVSVVPEANSVGKEPTPSPVVPEANLVVEEPTPAQVVPGANSIGEEPIPSTVVPEANLVVEEPTPALVIPEANSVCEEPTPSPVVPQAKSVIEESIPAQVVPGANSIGEEPIPAPVVPDINVNDNPAINEPPSADLTDAKDEADLTVERPSIDHSIDIRSERPSIDSTLNGSSINEEPPAEIKIDEGVERRPGVIPLPTNFDESGIDDDIEKHPKASDDDLLIKEAIAKNDFLNKILKDNLLKEVVDSMYNREIKSKEVIIKEGEKGSHMYVSAQGRYEVSVKGKGIINTFEDVRVFGELAILYNAKRNATIKATKPGRVWVLDRSVYQKLMLRHNIKEQDEMLEFLQKVPKLNKVTPETLQKVTSLLKVEYFTPGTKIVKEGDRGDKFYIIRAGTVTITKEGEGVVANFGKGKYFGEIALLKEDFRQATVTADTPGVECLTLLRQHFINHFGELQEDGILSVPVPTPKISASIKTKEYQDVELNDLKIVTTLGVGGFGRVELVQHKKNNTIFALKYLKKIDMVEQNQQEHVRNERNIQMDCRSKFIVRLYRSYKDTKYIYFLMESCLGGDLWTLLQRQKARRFEEKDARFIAGCVLEAFVYLHERGIVYRDLKPENLLIDEHGYIKLTDFGFAKKLGSRGRTFTFAGTPEYVAPEIILSRGHDKSVDYWAFGIFIFELLTGRTPFRTNDASHMRTYNKILTGIDSVEFPSYVSSKARHIIEKLCRPIPTERLGCQRNGFKDIKTNRWFLGFDWNRLNEGKLPAPFKPKLKSNTDTRYFEAFKKDNDIPPDENSGWDEGF